MNIKIQKKRESILDLENKREWQERIEGWKASLLSRRAYCRDKGIPYGSFFYWQRKLQFESEGQKKEATLRDPSSASSFVELCFEKKQSQQEPEMEVFFQERVHLRFKTLPPSSWFKEILREPKKR